jgi:glycosyltransferase involved in cell wall biosynthesis
VPTEPPPAPSIRPDRIAIVHDYFTQQGGAERLVGELLRLFPTATIHTSVVDREQLPASLRSAAIRTTPLQRLRRHGLPLALLAPVLPTAFGRMRLDGARVVISSTTAFAHHVRPPDDAIHVAYCHSPPHFLWGTEDYFRGRAVTGRLVSPALEILRRSDRAAAGRVAVYLANSRYTAGRIRQVYGREAAVVYPPVDTGAFAPDPARSGRFLVVSRLRRHKRIDLAIAAATTNGWPLDIIGEGPDEPSLRGMAGPSVRFLGRLSDEAVVVAMARCVALIVPGTEDFGMTMAEVQAAGRPPVAFARGGALEIIQDGETGFLFDEPTMASVAGAMRRAMTSDLDADALVGSARRFDRARFDAQFVAVIARLGGPPGSVAP